MKRVLYLLLILPSFSLFGQSSEFNAPVIQNTETFINVQLTQGDILSSYIYLGGQAINPFNFSKEIGDYSTLHEKEYKLEDNRVSFNLLVNVDENLQYKDMLFFYWIVSHSIADSIVIAVANENDTIRGITRYNHDFFEESETFLEKRFGNLEAKYEVLTNRNWNNSTPKDNEMLDFENLKSIPPPPPPPPRMKISQLYKEMKNDLDREMRELSPIFIELDSKGTIKIEGNEIEGSNLEIVLKNIIQEIKDGHRPNTILHDFNAKKEVDLFAYLTVEDEVSVVDYLKLKQQIINICLNEEIHPYVEESFPYETNLIQKTLDE